MISGQHSHPQSRERATSMVCMHVHACTHTRTTGVMTRTPGKWPPSQQWHANSATDDMISPGSQDLPELGSQQVTPGQHSRASCPMVDPLEERPHSHCHTSDRLTGLLAQGPWWEPWASTESPRRWADSNPGCANWQTVTSHYAWSSNRGLELCSTPQVAESCRGETSLMGLSRALVSDARVPPAPCSWGPLQSRRMSPHLWPQPRPAWAGNTVPRTSHAEERMLTCGGS